MVTVNGKDREIDAETGLIEFLSAFSVDPSRVVVELNGDILARDRYQRVMVKPGDKLEIVHFVGGGCG